MEIINVEIEKLIPYENNPRNNERAVDKVANSIKEFGFKVPIVIDQNNVIVCGHTRYIAAKQLEMPQIPCIMASDLTEEQIKAFRLADNKTAEFSSWDYDLLGYELEEIGIDMSDFGFAEAEDVDINEFFVESDTKESAMVTEKVKSTITCPDCGRVIEL